MYRIYIALIEIVAAAVFIIPIWCVYNKLYFRSWKIQKAEWLSSPDFYRKEAKDHLYKSHLPSVEMGMPVASDNSFYIYDKWF